MEDLRPKPFVMTLMACGAFAIWMAYAFWFMVLFVDHYMMRGYPFQYVLFRILWLGGVTVIVIAPPMAYFSRDVKREVEYRDRQQAEEKLTVLLLNMRHSPRGGTDNVKVYELQNGFGPWRWPISIAYGVDRAWIVGPSCTVNALVRRFQRGQP